MARRLTPGTDTVQLAFDLDDFGAIKLATRELRLAAKRARADEQLRYADELDFNAGLLERLLAEMNQVWREHHQPIRPRR